MSKIKNPCSIKGCKNEAKNICREQGCNNIMCEEHTHYKKYIICEECWNK